MHAIVKTPGEGGVLVLWFQSGLVLASGLIVGPSAMLVAYEFACEGISDRDQSSYFYIPSGRCSLHVGSMFNAKKSKM